MKIKMPLRVGGGGAWIYDADGNFVADCSHSRYTCEQVRANAAAIAAMSNPPTLEMPAFLRRNSEDSQG